MMSFFLNPWTMVAGAALVLTPIIIHLINRMRFRRIQWAAMEFLLKAQKKMRRKKILEQLLLLLLRCLLVFLAGLLFARFLGFDPLKGKETRPTLHVVVLDDTPSMADTGEVGSAAGSAFTVARNQIVDKLIPAAMKANNPQRLRIIRLSDQADILNSGADPDADPELINAGLIDKVSRILAAEKPANYRVGLAEGLKKAKAFLDRTGGETAKVVYVVSDQRGVDWTRDAEAIAEQVKKLSETEAKVHLIDVASPNRKADRKNPAFSDNVGILEFKPRNRVAAKGIEQAVEFEIRVKNFGNTDLKNVRVDFFLNGQGSVLASINFETLPANQEKLQVVSVPFSQTATPADPLGRFNVVTAVLENVGADALAGDNVRHAVVDVREKLSVLLVTRPEDDPAKKDGDSFYLRNLFDVKLNAIDIVTTQPEGLGKYDLRDFSSVYLVNIPTLTDAQALQLERYVREGGGVGVFLGPDVKPEAYNKALYRNGDGVLPFPLPVSPTEPLPPEKLEKRKNTLAKRILVRESAAKSHPALRGIYGNDLVGGDKDTAARVEFSFMFAQIDRHWPIPRIGQWREDRAVQELYCLPNEAEMNTFEGDVLKLSAAVRAAYGEPKFEKYRPIVDASLEKIRTVSGSNDNPLTDLAREMDKLLSDQITEGDANEALLREFWGNSELAAARGMAQSLRDKSKYGDPLYVARKLGNGRVAVFTIPVGTPWTDWPTAPGSGWVPVMVEMQKYLAGGGAEENRVVGSPIEYSFETNRYSPAGTVTYLNYDIANVDKSNQRAPEVREPDPKKNQEPRKVTLATKPNDPSMWLTYDDAKKPGVYIFTLKWVKRDGDPLNAPSEKPEYVATVVNFDTEREGDLRRTNTDDFKTTARTAEEVHSPEDDRWLEQLEQKPNDLSSGRWIFLVILLVLIFEQAMAVRLSYHNKTENLEGFAPSAAAAMASRAAIPTGHETVA